jgi:hypothetical protein
MDSLMMARIRRKLLLSGNRSDCLCQTNNHRGCNENGPRMERGCKEDGIKMERGWHEDGTRMELDTFVVIVERMLLFRTFRSTFYLASQAFGLPACRLLILLHASIVLASDNFLGLTIPNHRFRIVGIMGMFSCAPSLCSSSHLCGVDSEASCAQ